MPSRSRDVTQRIRAAVIGGLPFLVVRRQEKRRARGRGSTTLEAPILGVSQATKSGVDLNERQGASLVMQSLSARTWPQGVSQSACHRSSGLARSSTQ